MKNKLFIDGVKTLLLIVLLCVAGMMKGYAYNVNVGTISNGTVAVNPTTANAGETVTLTATPGTDYLSAYLLENWTVLDTANNSIITQQGDNLNVATFIMPESDVTVTASFVRTHLLYLLFEDYQACEALVPQREWNGIDDIKCIQLPRNESGMQASWYYQNGADRNTGFLALAQNEREGFQVFFREQEKERNLRIEVSPFLNGQNVLQHSVYWEEFFWAESVGVPDSLAEALIPYVGETQRTTVGHNKVFFVELQSAKDQTPGNYVSTITVYDGNEVLTTRTVTAKVWNFALPENHYSEVVMGLYNRNSGYGATSSFLKLNGINVDAQGNVAESDLPAAKQILDGYQECMLNHGISTIEIPRWKLADDPKAAELTMADPRRKVFTVPVNRIDFNGTEFTSSAQGVVANYKSLVYDNPFLKDKAFFYPMDEPAPNQENQTLLNAMANHLADLWPGYHAVIPFYGDYSQTVSMLEGKADILCPNQAEFDPYNSNYSLKQSNFEDFKDRDNHPDRFRTWRYQGDGKCGGTQYWIYALSTTGVMRRIVFWQQYCMNSDGWLYWNCAFLPNNWVKKSLPASTGIQTGNGDGVLLYPGTMFGQSATTPIVSLRLKQLSSGIDDYDYLRMGKEFLSETEINSVLSRTYKVGYQYCGDCRFLNKQYDYYASYTCTYVQRARYDLGQLLSAANTEHNWGEWKTAVFPDETHNGLEIRTCSHCGAQESREKIFQTSTQEITLSEGWNWWSTNLIITLDELKGAIADALGTNGSATIKSQDGAITYRNGQWRGTAVQSLDIKQLYEIQTSVSCEITVTGMPANPVDYEITIHNGNNWIGYLPNVSMTLDQAFGTFPVNGDIIKSKDNSAAYHNGQWRGLLTNLQPGKGYIYKSNTGEDRTFVFPAGR